MRSDIYLLGAVPPGHSGNRTHGSILTYSIDNEPDSRGPLVGIYELHAREGGSTDVASWFKNCGEEWFFSICREAGCAWFLPLAQRLAKHEGISLDEVAASYAAANQGQPMPRGTIDELFAYAKQRGLLK